MHMQPVYQSKAFVTAKSDVSRGETLSENNEIVDVGADIFDRGLCLPSDNKMTVEEQNRIIEIVRSCFE